MAMAVAVHAPGLRERKKQQTRETLVAVATRLFAEQGYEATTVAQIAHEAMVAETTLFNYFSAKVDLVFSLVDEVTESARERILGRRESETATAAIVSWVANDLPEVETPYAELARKLPVILAGAPELQGAARLRLAILEDVFAAAYATDLGESPDGLRAHVMAAIALGGLSDVWASWYERHADDPAFDLRPVFPVKADYLDKVLRAGLEAIELLPRTPEFD
jgi:AcrR family transcriptional regulator